MKNIFKNNLRLIAGIIMGILVASSTAYAATILFQSNEVGYDNSMTGFKDSNGNDVTDVETALEELYLKASNIVYFDPVSTSACNKSTFNLTNVKNGTSTCFKWRIISTTGNDVTLQMDHNLINPVAWSTSGTTSGGPDTILSSLATATSGWTRVEKLNYTYNTSAATNNYGLLSCVSGVCSITKDGTTTTIAGSSSTPLRARLITGEEIAAIVNSEDSVEEGAISKTWNIATTSMFYFSNTDYKIGTVTSGTGNKNLSWLVANTITYANSGSTSNEYGATNYGYWTLTPLSNNSNNAWNVGYYGGLFSISSVGIKYHFDDNYGTFYYCGARPVITISKSLIQ